MRLLCSAILLVQTINRVAQGRGGNCACRCRHIAAVTCAVVALASAALALIPAAIILFFAPNSQPRGRVGEPNCPPFAQREECLAACGCGFCKFEFSVGQDDATTARGVCVRANDTNRALCSLVVPAGAAARWIEAPCALPQFVVVQYTILLFLAFVAASATWFFCFLCWAASPKKTQNYSSIEMQPYPTV